MRIKSHFRDYYDGVAQNGIDHEILYLRKTVRVGLGCEPSIYDGVLGKLIFPSADQVIDPISRAILPVTYQFWRIGAQLFHSVGVGNRLFFARGRLKEFGFDRLGYVGSMFDRKDFFDQDYSLDGVTEPVYLIESSESRWPHIPTLILNPNLSVYNFGAVLPPNDAWQAIYTHLCNQARPSKPIPEMSNDVKVILAGFNTKTSFRKDPPS